jgi:hypothetical protein
MPISLSACMWACKLTLCESFLNYRFGFTTIGMAGILGLFTAMVCFFTAFLVFVLFFLPISDSTPSTRHLSSPFVVHGKHEEEDNSCFSRAITPMRIVIDKKAPDDDRPSRMMHSLRPPNDHQATDTNHPPKDSATPACDGDVVS